MNQEINNLTQVFKKASLDFKNQPAFLTSINGKFEGPTFGELYDTGVYLAASLLDLGIEAKKHIGIIADNCLEWMIASYAVQLSGCADVPRGTDATDQDIIYILSHADVETVFVENLDILQRILKNKSKLPKIKNIILMKKGQDGQDVLTMYDLIDKGKKLCTDTANSSILKVEERIEKIQKDDLATLIYTSGTTGNSKGVMLSHGNITSQINNLPSNIGPRGPEDRILSILPIWHIFERGFELICISKGAATYYTNIRDIREHLKVVKPTFMASAPRMWENIYLGIMKKIKSGSAVKHTLFKMAYYCSKKWNTAIRFLKGNELDLENRSFLISLFIRTPIQILLALTFLLPYLLLDAIVLKKIRLATGGCLKFTISGGGALPLHVDLFFNNIGILVLEGYGMTETSPVIAVRRPSKLVIGSVGNILPKTKIRIVEINTGKVIYPPSKGVKGEVHIQGPQVMQGYYKNQEETEKVLQNTWMNTGDLGIMTYNNTLKLVGRSKETIVLLGGENVEPVPIEAKLSQSNLIEHCMVTGQDQKFLSCLIVPSLENLSDFGDNHESIASSKEAKEQVRKEIQNIINARHGFKTFEKILDCHLVPKEFSVGDELTNTFKLRRHVITTKYSKEILAMYQ